MPLKLSLKPHEKFVVNGVVITNGDNRSSLVVHNKASILREKDILQPDEADTPVKRVYFPVMMMYLEPESADRYHGEFADRLGELMDVIENGDALSSCVAISKDVLAGDYYKALNRVRKLFDFEQERLAYVPESVSAGG